MSPKHLYPDHSTAPGSAKNIVRYYLLTFAIAWLVWVPMALSSWSLLGFRLPAFLSWLGGVAPIFAGAFMTCRESGKQGLKQLLFRWGMWKFHPGWYLVAFGLPVLLILLDLGVYRLAGGQIHSVPLDTWPVRYLSVLAPLLVLSIFEEAGWRGYASPRLQSLLGKWGASLVLGSLWGIWHIPYYLIRGVSFLTDFDASRIVLSLVFFIIGTTAFETTMTWLFSHTRGSLLFACIFHASNNAFVALAFIPTAQAGQGSIFIWSAIVGWAMVFVILGVEKWILSIRQKQAIDQKAIEVQP